MLNMETSHRLIPDDGLNRRNFLRAGTLSLGGLTIAQANQYSLLSQTENPKQPSRSVILFWLDGGPTHMDTYDPKMRAPLEYRGPFKAIDSSISGITVSELCRQQSTIMDKVSLVRSVYHNNADHFAAAHWMWTGIHGSTASDQEPMYPSMGSVISKTCGPARSGMPPFVAVPYSATIGLRPGYQSAAYLGTSFDPFDTNSNPNSKEYHVPNLELPDNLTLPRIGDRRQLLGKLEQAKQNLDNLAASVEIDSFNRKALEMITGDRARRAFDIDQEPESSRLSYGRTTVGQSALLARRLVEEGVRFVSIHHGGWDNHSKIEPAMKRLLPPLDQAVATLITDLQQRGMLDDVLVVVMGEFGRTPKVNPTAGRDHWGNAMSVLLAGGAIRGGQIVGATNIKGQHPVRRPVKPSDILATIYHQLGIPTHLQFTNRAGRPIPILGDGRVLSELV